MIGVVVGAFIIISVIVIVILCCVRRRRLRKSDKFTVAYSTKNGVIEVPDAKFGSEKSRSDRR